jgi:DNA-binding transcriptional LysR family regulator
MPEHLVAAPVADGRLIEIEDDPTPKEGLVIYSARRRDHMLGPASRWLLDTLRQRLGGRSRKAIYDCSASTS